MNVGVKWNNGLMKEQTRPEYRYHYTYRQTFLGSGLELGLFSS